MGRGAAEPPPAVLRRDCGRRTAACAGRACPYPQFSDGGRAVAFVEAVLESAAGGYWWRCGVSADGRSSLWHIPAMTFMDGDIHGPGVDRGYRPGARVERRQDCRVASGYMAEDQT
jgi:hypothetical protein